MSEHYVATEDIRHALYGRETEFVTALGIPRQNGSQHIRCPYPAHKDRHPSWRWDSAKNRAYCTCSPKGDDALGVLMRIVGISFDAAKLRAAELLRRPDLIRERGDKGNGRANSGHQEPRGISLAQYAEAKGMSVTYLSEWGLVEESYWGAPAIRIPYRSETGAEEAVRYRISLNGKDRFRWREGDKSRLYGLDRLAKIRQAGLVILVEGESDTQTLWLHDFPALGLPGGGNWNEERDAALVADIPEIYVVIEPDQGGEAAMRWLARSAIAPRARLVRMVGAKDPNELYRKFGDGFRSAFQQTLDTAEPFKPKATNGSAETKSGDAGYWPDPEPVIEPEKAERPYPLDALPRIISAAAEEYRAYGQQPLSMIASSALAATSLASQGLADVARDARLVGPISLNFGIVAVSGERKTSADRHFTRALREWQTAKKESVAAEEGKARAARLIWEAEREGLLGKIKNASGKKADGNKADIEAMKTKLSELEQNKPISVITPYLFYEDVNAETLAVTFAEGWPSASLWSDEGGLVVGSGGMSDENLMKFVALLNRLWDGHPFERLRLTARCAHIKGRRFTVSLMMQPVVMARLLGACGGAARNMGFVARNLVAWPASTIGLRAYVEPPADMSASNRFNGRLSELLDLDLTTEGPQMSLAPPPLKLSWQAKRDWTAFFNDIEGELSRSGEFGDVPDIGSKIAENAARLAGVFHVVEHGPAGEIGKQLMDGAIAVVAWHLTEARRVIGANRMPEDIADADLLLEWFLRQEDKPVEPREILRRGPDRLREKKRRDAAVKVLADRFWLFESGKPTRLTLNPKARTTP